MSRPQHRTLLLATALALAAAGCDALRSSPGSDFRVRIEGPTPIPAVGLIDLSVPVTVTGCDAFDAAVRGPDGAVRPTVLEPGQDGTLRARVPVAWLRGDDGDCAHDADSPLTSPAQLLVTCRDAGRTQVADFAVAYGAAARAYDTERTGSVAQVTIQALFPSDDPWLPYSVAPSSMGDFAAVYPLGEVPMAIDGPASLAYPLVRPRLAASAHARVVSSGCASGLTCPDVPLTPTASSPGDALTVRWTLEPSFSWPVWVPRYVVDLAFVDDRTLLVLSQLSGPSLPPAGVALTRVSLDPEAQTTDASVIGYFPGEWAMSRFARMADGRLAFLSYVFPELEGPITSMLRATDGASVVDLGNATGTLVVGHQLPSIYTWTDAQLAPDASSLVVGANLLGSTEAGFLPLPTERQGWADGDRGGAVWLDGAVALWNGQSLWWGASPSGAPAWAEAFDAAPPHARRYRIDVAPLAGGTARVTLFGATALGDALVLTTSSGLRIHGPDGALIGGSDPLPCGLAPTAPAVRTGPGTVAVAAGSHVYVFEVGGDVAP